MYIERHIMYTQATQAAIDYAKNAIQFSFWLNGAAATALFAQVGKGYDKVATWFMLGAICATVSMALAYMCQAFTAEIWGQEKDPIEIPSPKKNNAKIKIKHSTVELIRWIAALLWLSSMGLALYGLYAGATTKAETDKQIIIVQPQNTTLTI